MNGENPRGNGENPPDPASATAYWFLRLAVGWLGIVLPLGLLIGNIWFFAGSAQDSISYYYYTHMRNFLVGDLCAIGVFLLFYWPNPRGVYRADAWLTNLAGLLAICVAFCPTRENKTPYTFVNHLHPIFAGSLFITLALIALFLFTRGRRTEEGKRTGKTKCYIACGIIILLCSAAAFITSILNVGSSTVLLYVLETIAVMAFAVSWLVKGWFKFWLTDWFRISFGLPGRSVVTRDPARARAGQAKQVDAGDSAGSG